MTQHNLTSPLLFDFHLVIPSLVALNQKQAFAMIALEISNMIGMGDRILFEKMMDKEKSNSSPIGDGCAVMNLQTDSLTESLNVFVRLKKPIPMNAPDDKDIDLFCVLLTPKREGTSYLRNLSRLSRFLKDEEMSKKLRIPSDEKSLKFMLSQEKPAKLAA